MTKPIKLMYTCSTIWFWKCMKIDTFWLANRRKGALWETQSHSYLDHFYHRFFGTLSPPSLDSPHHHHDDQYLAGSPLHYTYIRNVYGEPGTERGRRWPVENWQSCVTSPSDHWGTGISLNLQSAMKQNRPMANIKCMICHKPLKQQEMFFLTLCPP